MQSEGEFMDPKLVINNANPGDLIEFDRGSYSHFGVYSGNGKVIHPQGGAKQGSFGFLNNCCPALSGKPVEKTEIKEDDLIEASGGSKIRINNSLDNKYNKRDDVLGYARARIGEKDYNLLTYNCEHFANNCRYGQMVSQQVKQVDKAIEKGLKEAMKNDFDM